MAVSKIWSQSAWNPQLNLNILFRLKKTRHFDTAPVQASIANSILVKEEIRLADEVRKEIKAFKRVAWLPGSFADLVILYGSDFLDPNIE